MEIPHRRRAPARYRKRQLVSATFTLSAGAYRNSSYAARSSPGISASDVPVDPSRRATTTALARACGTACRRFRKSPPRRQPMLHADHRRAQRGCASANRDGRAPRSSPDVQHARETQLRRTSTRESARSPGAARTWYCRRETKSRRRSRWESPGCGRRAHTPRRDWRRRSARSPARQTSSPAGSRPQFAFEVLLVSDRCPDGAAPLPIRRWLRATSAGRASPHRKTARPPDCWRNILCTHLPPK